MLGFNFHLILMAIKSMWGKGEVEPTLWEGLWLRSQRPPWHPQGIAGTINGNSSWVRRMVLSIYSSFVPVI